MRKENAATVMSIVTIDIGLVKYKSAQNPLQEALLLANSLLGNNTAAQCLRHS